MGWDTFERYRQKGLDARRAGQWGSAKVYLLEAAREMATLGRDATSPSLRDARQQTARRLLELARDCGDAAAVRPTSPLRADHASPRDPLPQSPTGSTVTFDDVAGLDEVKEIIRLKMIYPFSHPDLAQRYGIERGGGVLLYGPPGTGKTLLARAVAGEIDAAFYRVSPADILSKWVGEAEQNIQKLFAQAVKQERSVVFIDEIEALVPARRDEGSGVMGRVVPQILQAVEGFDRKKNRGLLLLGATNVPWQLDPAMLRPGRFDEKIHIPLPDAPARRRLLEIHLQHRPVAPDVDLPALAEQLAGYSGADIKHLCDRAATIPFLAGIDGADPGDITPAMLDTARQAVIPSVSPETLKRFEAWARETNP